VKGKYIGPLAGALVGLLWMTIGFGEMLFVAICAFIGWLVVGVLEGELDLRGFYDNLRRK
jgi:uncharacterized membrane protein